MMIAELKDEAAGRSLVAAIVGSCRVYGPLGSLAKTGSVRVLWNKFTPFTYDLEETYQYLRYCRGELHIPEELKPFTFNGVATATPLEDLSELLQRVQLFIVEVSSLNSISCREFYLDHNMLGTNFIRGKGKLYLDWWRDLTAGKDVAALADRIIADHSSRQLPLDEWHKHILLESRLLQADKRNLPNLIKRLCNGSVKPWMFVSHFQISTDPKLIRADRAVLLDTLQFVTTAQGHRVFDPSPVVISYTRERALAGNGADHFHYAAEFMPVMGAAISSAALDQGAWRAHADA